MATKWIAICFIGVAAALATENSFKQYSKTQIELAAMKYGYEQKKLNGDLVWVKSGNTQP